MLWRLIMFYEAMCIAGTLTYFVVVITKEIAHYVRTKDVRIARLEDYFKHNYGIGIDDLTKHDYVEAAAKYLFAGWFYGMAALNLYYDFLDHDAKEQRRERVDRFFEKFDLDQNVDDLIKEEFNKEG